jgi:acyl carrier protein
VTPTADAVRRTIAEHLREAGAVPAELPADFDVLRDGGLDSLGFLELLTRLETDYDTEIDLSEAPDSDVTRVGALVDALLRSAG